MQRLEVANGNLVRVFVCPSAAPAITAGVTPPSSSPVPAAADAAAAEAEAAVAAGGAAGGDRDSLKYMFVIGSVDGFERKLGMVL